MKKLLLAAVTSALVFTSVPTQQADASKKTTYSAKKVTKAKKIKKVVKTKHYVKKAAKPKKVVKYKKVKAQRKYYTNNVATVARSIAKNRVYVYGANNNYAVDCSAFAQQVMRAVGKSVPRTTYAQMAAGKRVYNPQPGDLVYFNGGSHVGVYIGNGRMVDALNPREGVRERAVSYIRGSVYGYYRF
ncbi:C40 family peptidase [Macrococcoides caseolyticum]|uniref:C40 family peptidase n=1 Tax=Macrococcoides caseolyticum TaxID=69966 RepID=UPI001F21467B|nr:C40 family peptidase [Macrococcus caseolyticus]MCE4955979.1 C40 family peptidase [Macrococcus caseolyticus]